MSTAEPSGLSQAESTDGRLDQLPRWVIRLNHSGCLLTAGARGL